MNKFLNMIGLIAVASVLGAASCNPSAVPQKETQKELEFENDLAKYRPQIPKTEVNQVPSEEIVDNESIATSGDISYKLDVVLDSVVARNREAGILQGYTILVYSGTTQLEAQRVKNRMYDIVPDDEAKLEYKLPTYFVKIGQFYQQIEAQTLYNKIRAYYPDATIVPERFPIEE